MPRLRIGLAGYGSWTRGAYIPALKRDARASIVSVAAPSAETRDRIRRDLGPDVSTFNEIEGLLGGPKLDAVMIAVPDGSHEDTLLASLESDVAVFYEPPIADTRHRVLPVMNRLLAARQTTFADLELGLVPAVTRIAQLLQANTIGRVQTASIRLQSGWGPVPNHDLCNFNHLCTWYVDVLNRILDSTPRRVLLLDGIGTPGRRQNHSIGHLDYEGVWGTLHANISSVGELEIVAEVNGDDGDATANILTGEVRFRTRHDPNWHVEQWPALSPHASWPGMHESVAAFLAAVEDQGSALNDARSVARLVLVGLAAEQSKDSGAWAEVDDIANIFDQTGERDSE